MEFLDEYDDGRPRLVFKSHQSQPINEPSQSSHFNNPISLFTSLLFSLLFLLSSLFYFQSQLLQSLLFWFSLSLLLGPFAPPSLTGGDVTVGQGHIVEFPVVDDHVEAEKKVSNKRNRGKRFDLSGFNSNGSGKFGEKDSIFKVENGGVSNSGKNIDGFSKLGQINDGFSNLRKNDEEWSDEDVGLLRKQIVKNPVGKPRRWEVIAEVFKGKFSVESVISKGKSLGSEKPSDSDSYSKFLKDRKVADKRLESVDEGFVGNEESGGGGGGGGGNEVVVSWSSSEDIALLNALKAFPKEVGMRWEKIAASVPGKSKAACVKRVSDLKKEFRSSKGSG